MKIEIKKITAMAFMIVGIVILTFSSVTLILTKLSLPPYSLQTEGKYVAYSLEVYKFLFFLLPLAVFLLLVGYLGFPSMFRRFYGAIRVLSTLLAMGGFGVTVLVMRTAIVNYFPLVNIPIFMLTSIAGLSPFWMMAILAILVFRKSTPQ